MLHEKKKESFAKTILDRERDYGITNPVGSIFDRIFNRSNTKKLIDIADNQIGQSKTQLSYPTGMSADGYGAFNSPTMGVNPANVDPRKIFELQAQNLVQYFWRKNRERTLKYQRVAGRGEVSEALDSICNEAIYPDDGGEICSLNVSIDAPIGTVVKDKLHKIFRLDILTRLTEFRDKGWELMRDLLVQGRVFLEINYDPKQNKIVGLNQLPQHNMIVVVQDGIIVGFRQMLEGVYASTNASGKNYVDFSPNQILYADLGLYGPGGINDPRSILEEAIKPFNQLNAIEDAITMYRIMWGSEKLLFKIDVTNMPKPKVEKHLQDQSKILSRKLDFNRETGEVINGGRVVGLNEHFFVPVSSQAPNTNIERLPAGDNISRVEDLKYFKRNLVNAMKVPPGHVSALAGDGQNYTNGKIGEVTQSEVSFARMVFRYVRPLAKILRRLFVMVLNTRNDFSEDIKLEEYFDVIFNKSNSFQLYIDAEILNTNLEIFDKLMKHAHSPEEPNKPLSIKYAIFKGLKMKDQDMTLNEIWRKQEAAEFDNKSK